MGSAFAVFREETSRVRGVCHGWTVDWLKRMWRHEPISGETYKDFNILVKLQEAAVQLATRENADLRQQAAAQKVTLGEAIARGDFGFESCYGVARFRDMEDGCYYVSLLSNLGKQGHCFGVCFRDGVIHLFDQNLGIGYLKEITVDPHNGKMEFMKWHLDKYTRRRLPRLDVREFPADFAYIEWEVFPVTQVLQ
jgi:hypothetical protein